jgi:hypothetical protein
MQSLPLGPVGRRRSSAYPKKILIALAEAKRSRSAPTSPVSPPHIIQEKILSASRRALPASTLPPASYLPFDSTSSGDVDSDLDSNVSSMADSEAESESEEGPATTLQIMKVSPGHDLDDSGNESEASEYSEDSDDSSVDFLATARQIDPNTIRNQEREYDAAVADRLAEEIVAGSSAATAGGGSGFNTPAMLSTKSSQQSSTHAQIQSTTNDSLSSRSKLKRSRTSDTLTGPMKSKNQKTTD